MNVFGTHLWNGAWKIIRTWMQPNQEYATPLCCDAWPDEQVSDSREDAVVWQLAYCLPPQGLAASNG